MKKFTKEHEWLEEVEGQGQYKLGISNYAQGELGDVVFVDFPDAGSSFKKSETVLNIESVKAVSDVYAPVSGKVVEVNNSLDDSPELVNSSAENEAWLVSLEISDPSEMDDLMSEEEYEKYVSEFSK